ncbi:DUF305 domain-containing protein [Nocardioides koreensis]|uniref:DUF305 domain-containing protein n=1 Tax=Nocardioides koreensis TaxID=433651 RepID=A0ABN2ZPL5_9ACTN
MKKLTALVALLLATALSLTACGDGGTSDTSSDKSTATARFDDTDVEFAQGMIPHHQQAVEMSQLAESHAAGAEVRKLASDIESAQGPEIDTMTQWLQDWGKDVPSDSDGDMGGMGGMDMGDGSHMDVDDMPGMMSADDMHELDRAHGAGWDRMFLVMMIRHHEGAIEMARTEQAEGQNTDALALAEEIEKAQTTEIAQMKDMLAS